ncbi:MAG: 2Fe-2S iron-sulfur cluster binding domain-containing protein, partial [Spirochaetaceae bacterium]|nr:2Fe-2S iron-sulfur cluster binding domain-containing protein [Spirochaetaceae bacterium]
MRIHISPDNNQTALEILQSQGISLSAPCGGHGLCGKCRIQVFSDDGTSDTRLACSFIPTEDCVIELEK